jgi:phage FluMu protein Com
MKNDKNKTSIDAKCPWCHQNIQFDFKHLHETTTKTTTRLVGIYKKADKN